jgi:hypothetical protein
MAAVDRRFAHHIPDPEPASPPVESDHELLAGNAAGELSAATRLAELLRTNQPLVLQASA